MKAAALHPPPLLLLLVLLHPAVVLLLPARPPPGKAWASKAATWAAVVRRKSSQAQKPGPARPRTSKEQRTQAKSALKLVKESMDHFKAMTDAVPKVRSLLAAFNV